MNWVSGFIGGKTLGKGEGRRAMVIGKRETFVARSV
jgi:hypothetical protein